MARFAAPLCILLAVTAAGPVRAEAEADTRSAIDRVSKSIARNRANEQDARERERALTEEVTKLRGEMIATARAVQEREREAGAIEDEVKRLERELTAARDGLLGRRAQLGDTLGALQRIALRPPEAALVGRQSPVDTMRGALLLRAALDPLERDAAAFRNELDLLNKLRVDVDRERARHDAALNETRKERARLAGLVKRKEELRRRAAGEGRNLADRIDTLQGEERALRDLLQRLETEREKAMEIHRMAEAERREQAAAEAARLAAERAQAAQKRAEEQRTERARPPAQTRQSVEPTPLVARRAPATGLPMATGAYLMPAQGKLLQRFGEGSGLTGRGLLLDVRAGAQVVAPNDGKVAYAGPFRGYGVLLIIEHTGGYHTLLSGMTSLDAVAGQWVLAGEPVGTVAAVDGAVPNLYVELRHNGQPVDPLVRLAARNG